MKDLFVDTSVWSLLLRRDRPQGSPHVARLEAALENGERLYTTGLILQELLQGFGRPSSRQLILARFVVLPLLVPQKLDHVAAAELHSACRRRGIKASSIDALLASLCIRYDLMMLTTDADFTMIARVQALAVWKP